MDKNIGSIQTIIRILKTHWGEDATFASIDGDYFYEVSPNAQLGMELKVPVQVDEEGREWRPITATKLHILKMTDGYYKGHHDDYTIETI